MSDQSSIPRPVRELLRESIHSIEQLELLLLLRRAGSSALTAGELAHALSLSPESCTPALQRLVKHGLVDQPSDPPARFLYAPRSKDLRDAVSALADFDQSGRVDLMLLISENAVGRVRRRARRMFQETLQLKKKE